MNHIKILKREDGTKIEIRVSFYLHSSLTGFTGRNYSVSVYICQPGKRTFVNVVDSDSWRYRELSMEKREVDKLSQQLEYVSNDEIYETKKELWLQLSP